ncbi:MAG: hypothetical protein ACD_45C00229G0005 [uncultured bacterium]|nr:MAG: hypothetical protein ACD_45C00229G0005 [uncultured bacterium]
MLTVKNRIKKIIFIFAAIFTTSILMTTPAKSQGLAEQYLAYIMQYTYETAQTAYHIQEYVYQSLVIANSWVLPDTTETTANLQSSFANLTGAALQNATTQINLQPQLTKDFFGTAITKNTVPYANDMAYQTLLGQLYFNPDPRKTNQNTVDPAYNYLKNVAGLNISHTVPGLNWSGTPENKLKYMNYYTSVSAIQTYNGYLLSQLYADYVNGGELNKQQVALIQQASGSDWFTHVASENIGVVLRQILMYNSQLYVVMTQLLQTQKETLAAQAMTNTLLVIGNQFTESQLISKATGGS